MSALFFQDLVTRSTTSDTWASGLGAEAAAEDLVTRLEGPASADGDWFRLRFCRVLKGPMVVSRRGQNETATLTVLTFDQFGGGLGRSGGGGVMSSQDLVTQAVDFVQPRPVVSVDEAMLNCLGQEVRQGPGGDSPTGVSKE